MRKVNKLHLFVNSAMTKNNDLGIKVLQKSILCYANVCWCPSGENAKVYMYTAHPSIQTFLQPEGRYHYFSSHYLLTNIRLNHQSGLLDAYFLSF